jgi:integrase
VKPFKDVTAARVRFLSPSEQVRLVNACPPDFRALVTAALHTGSRYGPLTRLLVKDFNPVSGTIFIEKDKGYRGDKSRHVVLDEEGIEWFKAQAAGKEPDDLLLTRSAVKRITRKDGDPLRWMASDQRDLMIAACNAAGLESLTFHELRHTYASMLVNAGVPLAFIAEQLGHSNTRMVEKHYGHLCQTAKTDAIRKLMPTRGLSAGGNIEPLAIKHSAG